MLCHCHRITGHIPTQQDGVWHYHLIEDVLDETGLYSMQTHTLGIGKLGYLTMLSTHDIHQLCWVETRFMEATVLTLKLELEFQ